MGYTRELYLKSLRGKVTNKWKRPRMFSLACNLMKNDQISARRNFVEKSSCKIFPTSKLHWKKVSKSDVDFSTIEITPKKVRGNNMDFSTNEITPKKIRGNGVDFSTIEITSKKVRGNDVDIDVDSTWCARWECIYT